MPELCVVFSYVRCLSIPVEADKGLGNYGAIAQAGLLMQFHWAIDANGTLVHAGPCLRWHVKHDA